VERASSRLRSRRPQSSVSEPTTRTHSTEALMAHAEREWAEAAMAPAERERAEDPTHGRHALARPPLPFRSPSARTVASNRQGRPDGVRRRPRWPPPSADEPRARTRVPARTHPSAALLSWQSLESPRRPPDGRDEDGCPGGHRHARRRARQSQNVRSAESTQNRPRPFTHLS